MPRARLKIDNPLGGMNTSQSETGLPPTYFAMLRNARLNEKNIARRKGMKRVYGELECSSSCLRLDPCTYGDPSYVQIPLNTEVQTLGPRFTLDLAMRPDALGSPSDTCYVLGFDGRSTQPFTLTWDGNNRVTFTLTDSNANTWTLTSAHGFTVSGSASVVPVRVRREGTLLELLVAGTVEASRNDLTAGVGCTAPTTDLLIGSVSTDTTMFCGDVDELRLFSAAIPDHQHAFTSWDSPRDPEMTAYYRFNPVYNVDGTSDASADPIVIDDSRYGNHGLIVGSASFVAGLVRDLSPVVGLIQYLPTGSKKQLVWGSGESLFSAPIG